MTSSMTVKFSITVAKLLGVSSLIWSCFRRSYWEDVHRAAALPPVQLWIHESSLSQNCLVSSWLSDIWSTARFSQSVMAFKMWQFKIYIYFKSEDIVYQPYISQPIIMQHAQHARWKEMASRISWCGSCAPPRKPFHRPTNVGLQKSANPAQPSHLGQLALANLLLPIH